ncbi:hypothetical protein EDB83DRAFT_298971 [Lactarius deliciosus]|nr:hypothetical protein EDB83DRAFT_298971 [Lactarius deliciosus]
MYEIRHLNSSTSCALWNQIVLKAQNDNNRTTTAHILKPIRKIYATLHQDTDTAPTGFFTTSDEDRILLLPTSYPLCNIPRHHSDSTLHIHDDSTSATFAYTGLHDHDAAPAPTSLAGPDAPFLSVVASHHVLNSVTHAAPLGDIRPVHQTTTESLRTPATSPTAANAILDTSGGTILDPTPETLTSVPRLSSTPPPTAASLQHNADLLTPSDMPNLPSSASFNPVPDNILPTVTTVPNASPKRTSEIKLGAAGDDGSPNPGSRKEKDALDARLVNRALHANITATLDLPPKYPSLRSVSDMEVTIMSPSLRGPNSERTGLRDCPPRGAERHHSRLYQFRSRPDERTQTCFRMISSNASPINTSKVRMG